MNISQILKTSQEQALASWINYENQLRINRLLAKLTSQDINFKQALEELQKMKFNIDLLISSNRGGSKGMHGYIAEISEVGIENAKNMIKGLSPIYEWINDNGPVDLIRNGTKIQQKFINSYGHFGLEKVKEHFEKYPDFIKNGGKYQIPKDFFNELQKLMNISQETAAKESTQTYRLWKWVHDFFNENKNINLNDFEPSNLNYSEVQVGNINSVIKNEKNNIKKENQKLRKTAYETSKPTLKEGMRIAAISAATEGVMNFCIGIVKKLKKGKHLSEFTAQDWKDVGIDTTKGTVKGCIRGTTIYTMTNFTETPAAIASSLVTAVFGVTTQAYQLKNGTITNEDFIINSEVICMEVSVSAIASLLGEFLIPVPILGAIIGNMTGMFMYQISKDYLSSKEQALIQDYRKNFDYLNKKFEEQYKKLVSQLKREFEKYTSILEWAFNRNTKIAFNGSIALADYVGVDKKQVLRNKTDIDNYFLN